MDRIIGPKFDILSDMENHNRNHHRRSYLAAFCMTLSAGALTC